MAFSFVVETGIADPDANSYCTVEFADDYVEANTHVSSDWTALDDATKERLLVRASKTLDVRFRWQGTRVDQDSGLKWPRSGVYDEDGFQIGDDVIPRLLQEATAEMATYLMSDDWTAPRENDQFKELQVDVIDIKFDTDYRRSYVPDTIIAMLHTLGFANSGKRPGFKPIIRT
jgi:hypothetical protein